MWRRSGARVSHHNDAKELSTAGHRSHETAIEMEYSMWVMPTHEFLQLSELLPHEDLCAAGKVVRADNSMDRIFYLSHEWTSEHHPDHSTSQLHTMQTILLRMLRGTLRDTSPTFTDAMRLPSNTSISSAEWKKLVIDSFIWMDFISVRGETESAVCPYLP